MIVFVDHAGNHLTEPAAGRRAFSKTSQETAQRTAPNPKSQGSASQGKSFFGLPRPYSLQLIDLLTP